MSVKQGTIEVIGARTNGFDYASGRDFELNGAKQQSREEAVDMELLGSLTLGQPERDGHPILNGDRHDSPLFVSEGSPSASSEDVGEALDEESVRRDGIAVIVPPVVNGWEYRRYEEPPRATDTLEEYNDGELLEYLVRFDDDNEEVLTFEDLRRLENGLALLADFEYQVSDDSVNSSVTSALSRPTRQSKSLRNTHISSFLLSSDDELNMTKSSAHRGRLRGGRAQLRPSRDSSDDDDLVDAQHRSKPTRPRSTRARTQPQPIYSDLVPLSGLRSSDDDEGDGAPRRKRQRRDPNAQDLTKRKLTLRGPHPRDPSASSTSDNGNRRSKRSARSRNMRELGEDDIPEQADLRGNVARFVSAKEHFKARSEDDKFRQCHSQTCDSCFSADESEEKGPMVYCQGCTISYHQKCLGPRNSREHLVTKIGDKDFVLQCRRCTGYARQKDDTAPDQGNCCACGRPGESTNEFRERKTAREEQKEREEHEGEDPVVEVSSDLLYNASNLLFRCLSCYRGWHLEHLPLDGRSTRQQDNSEEVVILSPLEEYSSNWTCKECKTAPADIDALVAWRPINIDNYEPGFTTDQIACDDQEYLVKWKKLPYTEVKWLPANWVCGILGSRASNMRKAFARRDNSQNLPKMTTEEAVPEDFMQADIVLDVQYTNVVTQASKEVARARIKEVREALVKFKGLGYEDTVWTKPPSTENIERWDDFQTAYEDWVAAKYIEPPRARDLTARLSKLRDGGTQNFKDNVVLPKQPESLSGGKLMPYQMEGLNWIYFQWYQKRNAILADEMGLGKTVQVIGFLTALQNIHACWPFLVVVPNSTCPNWRREIKQWAPSLRAVTYYGSAESKRLSAKYELFPNGEKGLACHVVVTSYEAAQAEEFRSTFRGVKWAGLIVDEGQRLKSDKNILYGTLNALKPPFKLLLTGTPLQNNVRELFNLLQFLDHSVNAHEMEEEYLTLTDENLARLHDHLREMFLRRTKAEVLKFLPSMAQIILPVSMSVLQKTLYKSILAQKPELIKSILSTKKDLGPKDRANLNNILMQLRKCLAHPYVYSRGIEDKALHPTKLYRNLVDASPKLKLLEVMLPKLKERGHRVLIFSQFLHMLDLIEEFLDGLGLYYQRLDGSMGSLQKQKRIDAFNAPDSSLFAFLLSTRAGGVGINLATADTVIILDPDYNPHQDIQALSRAHRIGQKKKVLVFQLTTRDSAEEKVMQIGKKKMLLDHMIIEQMDATDDAGIDVESILKHGADALFQDDPNLEIKYDAASVDRLLDRCQIEDTQTDNEKSAQSQFSFARVWANDKGTLEEGMDAAEDVEPDPSVWDKILKEREREAKAAAAAEKEAFGRGRRKRQAVDYATQDGHGNASSPARRKRKARSKELDSDTDFMEHGDESEDVVDEADGHDTGQELSELIPRRGSRASISRPSPSKPRDGGFKRAELPAFTAPGAPLSQANPFYHGNGSVPIGYISRYGPANHTAYYPPSGPQNSINTSSYGVQQPPSSRPPNFMNHTSSYGNPYPNSMSYPSSYDSPYPPARPPSNMGSLDGANDLPVQCVVCGKVHSEGYCPLKLAGVEYCNLCGLAHYGHARTCPHIDSVTQLRAMNEALKYSPEPQELKELAKKKILGIIGDLNQRKRKEEEKREALRNPQPATKDIPSHPNGASNGMENRSFIHLSTHGA